jgi:hypothetical protein
LADTSRHALVSRGDFFASSERWAGGIRCRSSVMQAALISKLWINPPARVAAWLEEFTGRSSCTIAGSERNGQADYR